MSLKTARLSEREAIYIYERFADAAPESKLC